MYSYYYYQPYYSSQGWQCPRCARCYAPSVGMCWHCQPLAEAYPNTTVTISGTGEDGQPPITSGSGSLTQDKFYQYWQYSKMGGKDNG